MQHPYGVKYTFAVWDGELSILYLRCGGTPGGGVRGGVSGFQFSI